MPSETGSSPPEPVNAKQGKKEYSLYFNGYSDEVIAAWFEERHGYPPDEIIMTGGGKLAGPLISKAAAQLEKKEDANT